MPSSSPEQQPTSTRLWMRSNAGSASNTVAPLPPTAGRYTRVAGVAASTHLAGQCRKCSSAGDTGSKAEDSAVPSLGCRKCSSAGDTGSKADLINVACRAQEVLEHWGRGLDGHLEPDRGGAFRPHGRERGRCRSGTALDRTFTADSSDTGGRSGGCGRDREQTRDHERGQHRANDGRDNRRAGLPCTRSVGTNLGGLHRGAHEVLPSPAALRRHVERSRGG